MQLTNILGQNQQWQRVAKAFANEQLGHAQFIADANGEGGFAFAMALSKLVLCKTPLDNRACKACASCKMVDKLSHPDLHFSFPIAKDAKTRAWTSKDYLEPFRELMLKNPQASLDEWLEQADFQKKSVSLDVKEAQRINTDLNLKAFMGDYKVMLVWHADRLNVQASNKLLKLIEEPEGKTLLLFTGTSIETLLPTLQSRIQLIKLQPIDNKTLAQHLFDEYQVEEHLALEVANLSNGNLSLAKQWLFRADDLENFSAIFVEWVRLCFKALQKQDLNTLVTWSNQLASWGRDQQIKFLDFAIQYFRKAFFENYQLGQLAPFDLKSVRFDIQKFCPYVHAENCTIIIEELELACRQIKQNINSKIIFLDVSFKVARQLHKKQNLEQYGM
ncbi:MAG: ATP-binding protein [Flavobacteriales bacterium]